MADKQTIDVTRCIHFDKSDMPNGCTCYWDGECNHDCYYKQLKRKEQQLEQEKAEINKKELIFAGIETSNRLLIEKIEKFKQTLTEIKEIAEICSFTDSSELLLKRIKLIIREIGECEVKNERR